MAVVFHVGCESDADMGRVRGVVTFEGKPIRDASVTFMPSAGGRPAFGITDAEGKYELTTFTPGDGALVGVHTVTIMAVDEKVSKKAEALGEEYGSLSEVMQPSQRTKQIWRIPEQYSEAETSGLQFEVTAGELNQADFSLAE